MIWLAALASFIGGALWMDAFNRMLARATLIPMLTLFVVGIIYAALR